MNDCHYEKDYLVYTLPNISKLHIVQLHVVQKYLDIAFYLYKMIHYNATFCCNQIYIKTYWK